MSFVFMSFIVKQILEALQALPMQGSSWPLWDLNFNSDMSAWVELRTAVSRFSGNTTGSSTYGQLTLSSLGFNGQRVLKHHLHALFTWCCCSLESVEVQPPKAQAPHLKTEIPNPKILSPEPPSPEHTVNRF